MFILFLASLLAIFTAGAASLAGVAVSTVINRGTPKYWLVSVISTAIAIWIYFPLSPSFNYVGEYSRVSNLFKAGFSFTNLIAFIGGLFCIFMARSKYSLARIVSGISWALFLAFTTHFLAYLMA